MKRLKLILLILFLLPLTGCVKKSVASDVQSDAIAEYMAGLLLEYDDDYDQALIPYDELKGDSSDGKTVTQAPSKSDTADGSQTGESDKNIDKSATISDVIGMKNFDIEYKAYDITDTYPENSDDALFVLTHSKGYKLLVVSFTIHNNTDSTKNINLLNDNIEYQLQVSSKKNYSPLLSLLENDLQYIDLKLSGMQTRKGLLIFEIPEKTDTSDMKLFVSKDSTSATVKLK